MKKDNNSLFEVNGQVTFLIFAEFGSMTGRRNSKNKTFEKQNQSLKAQLIIAIIKPLQENFEIKTGRT